MTDEMLTTALKRASDDYVSDCKWTQYGPDHYLVSARGVVEAFLEAYEYDDVYQVSNRTRIPIGFVVGLEQAKAFAEANVRRSML